ncbi:SDR family oxidoreductase [Fulvimarina sp. MAC8]
MTGGAGLIGSGICKTLAANGWEVVSFDLEEGEGTRFIRCDVSNEESVGAAFDELGWGELDLLVNNAGKSGPETGPIEKLSLDGWRAITESHLTGAFLMTRAAVPLMGPGASIVNMISTRAFMAEPETEAYGASKGGLFGFTQSLAVSLGPKIRVNCIAPGWISGSDDLREKDHAQHPVGRVGRPEDIAEAVLYLSGAGFMTGQVMTLDGGMTRKMIYEH